MPRTSPISDGRQPLTRSPISLRPSSSRAIATISIFGWLATAGPAAAHGSERGFVLLLPTGYYLAGAAAAVAFSFMLVSFVPPGSIDRLTRARLRLLTLPQISPVPASFVSFLFLCLLIL